MYKRQAFRVPLGQSVLAPGEAGVPTEGATIVFYGDGTTSEGDVSESMVFASSFQSPLLHVMQNLSLIHI